MTRNYHPRVIKTQLQLFATTKTTYYRCHVFLTNSAIIYQTVLSGMTLNYNFYNSTGHRIASARTPSQLAVLPQMRDIFPITTPFVLCDLTTSHIKNTRAQVSDRTSLSRFATLCGTAPFHATIVTYSVRDRSATKIHKRFLFEVLGWMQPHVCYGIADASLVMNSRHTQRLIQL